MDDATNPEVESICLMWAAQTGGKTEILNNVIGFHIHHEPGPILMVQPTVEFAEAWSKDRAVPMFRDSPVLRARVAPEKSRSSGNTILHKSFPGGHLTAVGANAPSGLAGRPIRVLVLDEVDRYPQSAGVEGDPCNLAIKRTDTFHDAVIYKTSTPTIKGMSRIESEFELTDKNYWHVPCHNCHAFQILRWSQVQWDSGKPETARYVCCECGEFWTDKQRVDAIMKGQWRPTAPFQGKRGYHLSGLYSVFKRRKSFKNRLHQFASEFLEAKQLGEEAMKTWINTFLAETSSLDVEQIEVSAVAERAEPYGPELPDDVLVLVAGVDVQKEFLQAEIVGYGEHDESWGIETKRFAGSTDQDKVWKELDDWLTRPFLKLGGAKLRVASVCIDSGTRTKNVYDFCRERHARRVYACKGSSTPGSPLASIKAHKSSGRRILLAMVGTDTAKDLIFSRLKQTEPGPRYMHFPKAYGYDQEFYEQLGAEKAIIEKKRGIIRRTWVKKRERNEALDCRVYSLAALDLLRPDWEAIRKNLAAAHLRQQKAPESRAPTDMPLKPVVRPPKRSGAAWVNKWRRF